MIHGRQLTALDQAGLCELEGGDTISRRRNEIDTGRIRSQQSGGCKNDWGGRILDLLGTAQPEATATEAALGRMMLDRAESQALGMLKPEVS
jgi:hypothetical protein